MASIILSAVGSAVGGAVGGPIGAFVGARIGQAAGGFVDQQLFSGGQKLAGIHGPRLTDLAVQSSTYGRMIPIVYGTVRIAGNIIWAQPIKETVMTTTSSAGGGGKGGGGGRVTQTSTTYSYSASLAIAICEGAIDGVLRVWADAKQLDLSQGTYRIYLGTEDQLPDSFMQGFDGADSTPAYRGQAYIVVEDFPLADYGNRIPNFTFEVKKKMQYPDYNGEILEEMIHSAIMIPGAGEFVYDTTVEYKVPGEEVDSSWVQQGNQQPINMHNVTGNANALVSLDQLQDTCPNVSWVSVVVSWFGDDLDAGACIVVPGVEYQAGGVTSPDTWGVAGFTRDAARQITIVEGSPQYGGTPDDDSILHYLDELRARGFNIMFYPMLFMDVDGKPWRGQLTGSASDVASFFTKTNGFNDFITHYANLVATKVDAFVIGSELVGLTKVTDVPGSYPAVDALVDLAATVKGIVGSDVKVTYAADWSEYHHTDGGWYNMDPLWASDDIDVIGIDAYFPLTDNIQNSYDIDAAKAGWTSGEGYDWYYTDGDRTIQASLDPPYAWKNIAWFWGNTHYNPDSSATDWVPESKKIWFTEYGFPSVDNATNQPNVFYDPSTSASAFPRFSKGRVDFRAQRVGLIATESQWEESDMVERLFVWTWDARPYPYWPDLTAVWSDGPAWKTGHWIQGKLGISSLAAIVSDLCQRTGMEEDDIDVHQITDQVEGYVIVSQQTVRDSIEQLQQGYFFDSVESDNVLKFVPRGDSSLLIIAEDDLVPTDSNNSRELIKITRMQEIELPRRVNVIYLNRLANYQAATQYAQRETTSSRETVTVNLPIVFSDQVAKTIADVTLFSSWVGRNTFEFSLPVRYACTEPADVIDVTEGDITHRMRIVSTQFGSPGVLQVKAVAEDVSTYDFYTPPGVSSSGGTGNQPVSDTKLDLLDIPAFPQDTENTGILRLAAAGFSSNWRGASVFRSDDGGDSYTLFTDVNTAAVIGTAVTVLGAGPFSVFDITSTVTVTLLGNAELQSVTELAVLNGANAALIGDEVIQFTTATLVEPGKYTLSGLLRGRLGTERAIAGHAAGEDFVLLDGRIFKQTLAMNLINLPRLYKPVTVGNTLAAAASQAFTYQGVALKPYNPVHITAVRDGSANITFSWVRRTRISGDWRDGVDVALNEDSEAYEVEIMDGSDVVRTITGLTSPTVAYAAADQTADFGSPQSSVTLKVYQLSAVVGRGFPGEATV